MLFEHENPADDFYVFFKWKVDLCAVCMQDGAWGGVVVKALRY